MIYYGKETFYVENQVRNQLEYDYHFVLITEEVGNDYWRLIESGAREQAVANNVYLEYIGPEQANIEDRLNTFDRMIAANVDGIFIQGLPGERFISLLKKADDQGIPVVTVDADVPGSARDFYIGTDNYQAGSLAGKTIIEQTTGEINVGIVIGSAEGLNQQLRLKGFNDAIASVDRIQLSAISESSISEIGAAQATYDLLKNNPEINAMFGMSALDGIGIVQGVEEMNLANYPFIVSFDILPETLSLIEQDKIVATIAQYPNQIGRSAIELMLDLKDMQPVDQLNFTDSGVLQKEDIKNGGIISTGGSK